MTTWLLEDSTDPEQMLDGEVEQDKRHWFVGDVVVLDHSVICTQLKLFFVHNFLVRTIWHTKGGVDITPEKTSELIESLDLSVFVSIKMLEDHIELGSERSSGGILGGRICANWKGPQCGPNPLRTRVRTTFSEA